MRIQARATGATRPRRRGKRQRSFVLETAQAPPMSVNPRLSLARELRFDRRVQRLHVRDMACYAALPALAATADAATARGHVGVVLYFELTRLHVQHRPRMRRKYRVQAVGVAYEADLVERGRCG